MQILIVEDNPSTLKMLEFLLGNEGYRVQTASTAEAGLSLLQNLPIDLLVLDLMLPDGSGLDICRRVRADGINIPILVVSALGQRDNKLEALNVGADDYMTKPFDPAEVVARVHSLARRTHPVLAPQLQTMLCVGSICLDARNQCVLLRDEGVTIELTRMEVQLLHVLMRNVGSVVPHERLISDAWGPDYEGVSNQLEVYIHRLRSKLGRASSKMDLIKTVQGSGYEFAYA